MNRDEIMEALETLVKANANGFYSLLYNELLDHKENNPEIYDAIMSDYEDENFADIVDMILYFES